MKGVRDVQLTLGDATVVGSRGISAEARSVRESRRFRRRIP